jgi:hypothetical protein
MPNLRLLPQKLLLVLLLLLSGYSRLLDVHIVCIPAYQNTQG